MSSLVAIWGPARRTRQLECDEDAKQQSRRGYFQYVQQVTGTSFLLVSWNSVRSMA